MLLWKYSKTIVLLEEGEGRGIWIKYNAAAVQTAEDINKHFHYNKRILFTYETCFIWKYFSILSWCSAWKTFRIYLNIFRMDVLQYQTMFFSDKMNRCNIFQSQSDNLWMQRNSIRGDRRKEFLSHSTSLKVYQISLDFGRIP